MAGKVHVVGAGLAGLAAAVRLSAAGRAVSLYESGTQAGGRCRSYFDRELDCRIDNGNHLLLSGNHAARGYLQEIGAEASMRMAAEPAFAFHDLIAGRRWTLRLDRGRIPSWIFDAARRVPDTAARDYFGLLRLLFAGQTTTVAACLASPATLYRRLWQPIGVAALNTEAEAGSAKLLRRVVRETFAQGGAACLAMVPELGLSESFVDPALALLNRRGADIRFGWRLRNIAFAGPEARTLDFGEATIALGADDAVVLAVPPPIAAGLVPQLIVPTEHRAIVNAHYRWPADLGADFGTGVIGGLAEWIFRKRDVISVTISAADRLIDRTAEDLAQAIWRDVAAVLDLPPASVPVSRIVKERRATIAGTPAQDALRPGTRTAWRNLHLAGDWTATGLPATIEGAIRSGQQAAAQISAG